MNRMAGLKLVKVPAYHRLHKVDVSLVSAVGLVLDIAVMSYLFDCCKVVNNSGDPDIGLCSPWYKPADDYFG